MDKALQCEDMPIFGWTKVRTTSKYEGQAFARSISWLRYTVKNSRAAYVLYKGKKYYNGKYREMYPKRAANIVTHCFAGDPV